MSQKKYKFVYVRWETWNKLKACSKAADLPYNAVIAQVLENAELRKAPPLDYPVLLHELRHIGANINQLAKNANTSHAISENDNAKYFQNIDALKQLMTYIRETLEEAKGGHE